MHAPIGIPQTMLGIKQAWTPQLIARLNDHEVKVARIRGSFEWHAHANSDELFYVLHGGMVMEVEDGAAAAAAASPLNASPDSNPDLDPAAVRRVPLQAGDVFVVPRGVRHRPIADAPDAAEEEATGRGTEILMLEMVGTVNTGDLVGSERTVVPADVRREL